MGKKIVSFFVGVKRDWTFTFLSTFILGMLIHVYKFTNTLINHDGVYNYYSNQNIVGSGRWFLSIACGMSSYFDLPWINGLFSIIFIALTTVIIVDIFEIKNKFLMVLISGLMVAFPGIIETFYFEFTADGYMMAMLFAALSVRLSLFGDNKKWHKVIAAGMICLSCGIYQAYVSFAMVLALCYFATELLEQAYTLPEYLRWIKSQIIIYICGLASYFVIWKVCMFVQNVQANAYQGINEVGRLSVSLIVSAIINTFRTWFCFIFEWNVFKHGWTLYGVLNVIFLLLALGVLFVAIKKSKLYKQKIQFVFFVLCIFLMPFASCIWYFTSASVVYRPMMLQSICVIYVWIALLFDRWVAEKWSTFAGVLMLLIVFNNGIQANVAYYHLDKCYEYSYAIGLEMMSRIHLLDNGELEHIAVVGNIAGEVCLGGDAYEESRLQLLGQLLENNLLFDQEHTVLFLSNTFRLELPAVSSDELQLLEKSEKVKEMTCWPDAGSVKVIDNTIVIKLSDGSNLDN